jgi:hypothetical protein
MCIKIIRSDDWLEFNPKEPLEKQIVGAKEIVVNYDPKDPLLVNTDYLYTQMVKMYKNGISCNVDFRVNANNNLNGIKFERKIEKLKQALDTNEVLKKLTTFHANADKKLAELSEICLRKINE